MSKVCFIHRGGEEMASFRYRCKMPAEYLNTQGYEVSLNEGAAETVIFSKPCQEDLDLAKEIRDKVKIGLDICDNHFEHPVLGKIYRELAEIADFVVCPTPYQRELIFRATERGATVIPDPYEFEEVEPHADGDKLIWFGHKVNLKSLGRLPEIHDIRIITGPGHVEGTTFYSPENLHRGLLEANIGLFPTQEGGKNKSNNRVLNALRMGIFPICGNHPSYDELDMVWRGDVHTGIRWAKAFKDDLNGLVKEGQDYIRDRYSPEGIGEKWKNLLESC